MFGENGLIAKSKQSRQLHEQEKTKESLTLILSEYPIEKAKNGTSLIDFLNQKQEEGKIDEVTDNGDGTITVIKDGYEMTINADTLEIIEIGDAGKLLPRIRKIGTTTTTSSFTAKADVTRVNGGTVKYYYKLATEGDEKYKEITTVSSEKGAEVIGLPAGVTYDIKVVATNANGEVEDKTSVTTTKILIGSINFNKTEETVKEGKTVTLAITINPTNATNQNVTWESSNPDIATVSDAGVVTGKKVGETTITVRATDGSDKTATRKITVKPMTIADIKGQDVFTEPKTILDEKGNQVVVPKGFKISENSGSTVQEGIIIEDGTEDHNQFVWIPVSNINHDGSNKIIKNDGSEVEITLGRYTFDTSTGEESKVQYGSEYAATTAAAVAAGTVSQYQAGDYYYELTDSRISNNIAGADGTNTTAKNLQAFIKSVQDNHGYYLARYEASHSTTDDAKPASKIANVWTDITQPAAAEASRNMYNGNTKVEVESDLCNSYGWDTAIVYIQAMGHSNYANASCDTTGNTSQLKTGETGDEKCKIFDMAANLQEWTTEYSTIEWPSVPRGGCFHLSYIYTSFRSFNNVTDSGLSFRVSLYL